MVCCAILPPLPAGLARALIAGLTHEEQARAARLIQQRDRDLFAATHALLHSAVAWLAGERPAWVRYDGDGRPELGVVRPGPPIHFSLSHTAGLAVCALARGVELGVDAEAIEPGLEFLGIAAMQFAAPERAALAAAPPESRAGTFYRLWTLREAVLKASGRGFAMPSAEVTVSLDPVAVSVASAPTNAASRWHAEERTLSSAHQVALAARCPAGMRVRVGWEVGPLACFLPGVPDLP